MTNGPRYRRTPPRGETIRPGRLPGGRRLVVVLVGLGLLAVLAGAIVALGGDDDPDDGATGTSTPSTPAEPGGRAPDVVVAAQVLPAVLGEGWVETDRDVEPEPAEVDDGDPCAAVGQPIQQGLVVRATFQRAAASDAVEQAALVGGVVEDGTPVPSLDEQAVIDCIQQGLASEVAEGNEVLEVTQPLPDPPNGAELSGVRFEVRQAGGEVAGRFDLVLLRRDRAVSFALLAVLGTGDATPLERLVAVLDEPLRLAAPRLN